MSSVVNDTFTIERTYPETSTQGQGMYSRMIWDFYHSTKLGDVIVARQGRKRIAAVGTVIRTAYYQPNKNPSALGGAGTFPNHIDVRWQDSPRDVGLASRVVTAAN